MGVLFIFTLITGLVISGLLFFNKGEKAQEIKGLLKDLYGNLKDLFLNLKKLFLILKELIQSFFLSQPNEPKDESISSEDSSSKVESELSPPRKLESPIEESNDEINQSPPQEATESDVSTSIDLNSSVQESNDEINLDKENE